MTTIAQSESPRTHGNLKMRKLIDFSTIETIYNTRMKKDFIAEELKPLDSIIRSWKSGAYVCYGFFDCDEIVGYAFFVRNGNDYLLDYFAIAEQCRDKGYGSIFLRQLAEHFQSAGSIIVEVEDPEKAEDDITRKQRKRRLEFYLRNGYQKTEVTSTVFGVNYRILEIPTSVKHDTNELRTIYREIYRSILPAQFFLTQFQVH